MQDVALIFIAVISLPMSVILNFVLMFPFPSFLKKLLTSGGFYIGTTSYYAQNLFVPAVVLFASNC